LHGARIKIIKKCTFIKKIFQNNILKIPLVAGITPTYIFRIININKAVN
jgi:hypothetical protein